MKYRWFLLIVTLALASCNSQHPSNPNKAEIDYFGENSPAVKGDFLQFFYIYGGVDSLGKPLTKEIIVNGWRVQYFEKGRLEYHPENKPAYHITVGWLGDLLYRRRPPIPTANIPSFDDPNRHYFPQTGHTISGDFLHYFEAHGGSIRFGLPISEPFLWEGHLTQDFQSARFFWMPDKEPPVTLEEIGRVHLEVIKLDDTIYSK